MGNDQALLARYKKILTLIAEHNTGDLFPAAAARYALEGYDLFDDTNVCLCGCAHERHYSNAIVGTACKNICGCQKYRPIIQHEPPFFEGACTCRPIQTLAGVLVGSMDACPVHGFGPDED